MISITCSGALFITFELFNCQDERKSHVSEDECLCTEDLLCAFVRLEGRVLVQIWAER